MAKQKVSLCELKRPRISIYVDASLVDGKLIISGQDIGEAPEEFWGDSDYEYWLTFPAPETEKFFKVLCAGSPGVDPLDELSEGYLAVLSSMISVALLFLGIIGSLLLKYFWH